MNDVCFEALSAQGDRSATPITWSRASGTLPPGTTLEPDGTLTGVAIGGRTPSGSAIIDTSKFTACGGFYTIGVSVKNVDLPNGTVLWATLSGIPIGEITPSGGAGTTRPYVHDGVLRELGDSVFSHIPPFGLFESPILPTTGLFV